MTRPRVKICGLLRLEDAEAALRLGAEFLGLNFYAASPRSIEVADAVRLRRRIGDRARVVGVFVNHPPPQVELIARRVGLDLLQFHGDEGPGEVEPFGARAIKVFRVAGPLPHQELAAYPAAWGFLFDSAGRAGPGGAREAGGYGGTGAPWAWERAGSLPGDRPVFVAGGIRPDNVQDLLARLSPWGIDVGSGVEAAPGRKDPALMERLFEEIAYAQDARAT
ncbi:MAG TPA: phosphoribosylanthranilate isomerase [Thermoanaerobaculia bacterium]|nr:phosphoribosylanthranilate isomerase [Thermoanaerobaculia bacterium]